MTEQTSPSDEATTVPARSPDQTDRVILAAAREDGAALPGDVIVVDDASGELTAAALDDTSQHDDARVLSWSASSEQTARLAERFSAQIARGRLLVPAGEEPMALEQAAREIDAHHALMRLPKALRALDDRARRLAIARGAGGLTVVAGGRVKHMTRTQNDVLATAFTEVRASRGIGKSRALIGTGPRPDVPAPGAAETTIRLPVRGAERRIELRGIGGVFSGAAADAGSRLLLGALDRAVQHSEVQAARVIDLGSGNGLLTAYLAAAFPGAEVRGSDDDADAVASTRATLEASGLVRPGVDITWDSSLSRETGASADLVLLNPPFHDGAGVDATVVHSLLDAAARVLRPGGQLWFVHNSHLRYRTEVARRVGAVAQHARDRRFTVLSAVRG